jgi:hypothetical protein
MTGAVTSPQVTAPSGSLSTLAAAPSERWDNAVSSSGVTCLVAGDAALFTIGPSPGPEDAGRDRQARLSDGPSQGGTAAGRNGRP